MKSNPSLEVVKAPEASPVVAVPTFDVEAVFRLAVEKGGGADTLERLMAIRREVKAEQAKAAFDMALAAFQSECPVIKKTKAGPKNAYHFAPLDEIVEQTKALRAKHGFSHQITTETSNGKVKAICKVTHRDGHFDTAVFEAPIDQRNAMQSDPQKYAAALTFATRYAFRSAFGIVTGDDDNDGAVTRPKPQGPMTPTESTKARFLTILRERKLDVKAQAFAIDMSFIMPDEGLDAWPLDQVPATRSELDDLLKEIEAHQ